VGVELPFEIACKKRIPRLAILSNCGVVSL